MALQTQQVHLADPKETRVIGTVGHVATGASFGLHRHVFVDERALLVRVAFDTNGVPTWYRPHLPQSRGAVRIVAIATLNESLIDPMVIGLCEVCFCRLVTSIAELRLGLYQEVLRFSCVVRRMTIEAADVATGVGGLREVPLLLFGAVATQAAGIRLLGGERLEANDFADISTAFYVLRAGTMAGLAPVSVLQRRLEVWSIFKVVLVDVFVARLARIRSNILSR